MNNGSNYAMEVLQSTDHRYFSWMST